MNKYTPSKSKRSVVNRVCIQLKINRARAKVKLQKSILQSL